jgi:hypothetical protein
MFIMHILYNLVSLVVLGYLAMAHPERLQKNTKNIARSSKMSRKCLENVDRM